MPPPSLTSARPASRRPVGLYVAATAWLLVAAAFALVGIGSQGSRVASGLVGRDVVASTAGSPLGAVAMLGALLTVVLAAALFLGHGWAVYPLVVVAVVGVVITATAPSWLAVVLMAALVLGTAPLVTPRAYGYVTGAGA